MFMDNKGSIQTVSNPCTEWRSATLATKYFKCRHAVESGDIHCEYVPTDDNVADFFTKALTGAKFIKFCADILGIVPSSVVALSRMACTKHEDLPDIGLGTSQSKTCAHYIAELDPIERYWLGGAGMFG